MRRKSRIFLIAILVILTISLFLIFSTNEASEYSQNMTSNYLFKKNKGLKLTYNSDNATLLNGSFVCFYEINIYKFEAHNITFNYTDANTSIPLDNAEANYTWYLKSDTSTFGNGTLISIENGGYVLDFNTSSKNVGEYIISVNIEKENYTKPNMVIFLSIEPRPTTFLTLTGTTLELERGIIFPFIFYLEDSLNRTKLNDFSIRWIMGYFSGTLIPLSNGMYFMPFPTAALDIGSNILILDASTNKDYEIASSTMNIDITWEKILGIDAPIFYAILIISIIVCVSLVSYILIKRVRPPFAIRKINDSIEKINNKKRPISLTGIKSRQEIYKTHFEKDWQKVNKDPKMMPD